MLLIQRINYRQEKTSVNAGVRIEDSRTELNNGRKTTVLSVLPYITCSYKLNSKQNVKLAFNRTIDRPSVYSLNSFTSTDNAYSVTKGNPYLKPEFHTNVSMEHTVQLKSGFLSSKLFYSQVNDAMNNLTVINDEGVFETQMQNAGTIRQWGVQFLAALKTGPVTFNPVIRLSNMSAKSNEAAMISGVKTRGGLVFEPSFSSVLSLKKDLSFSAIAQYSTPKINIQDNSWCGILYFISVDKTFKNKFKVGALSALPFTRNFIYSASEIKASDFYSRYEGHLILSAVPLWLRLSYQFGSGVKRTKIERQKEEIDQRVKKGF